MAVGGWQRWVVVAGGSEGSAAARKARKASGKGRAGGHCALVGRRLWDPMQNPQNLILEFLRYYYGAAANQIESYINAIEAVRPLK